MPAAVACAAGRQNFCLAGNKLAQQINVFKINLLDIFLAKIAGFFHKNSMVIS